jgi:hypothetical protein
MLTLDQGRALAGLMADKLFETMRGGAPQAQGKACCAPIRSATKVRRADSVLRRRVGVHLRQREQKIRRSRSAARRGNPRRVESFCPQLEPSIEGIRATVVGASQYTIQLSGSTIYVAPLDAVPLRNVPVIAPELPLDQDIIDPPRWRARRKTMLKRLDLNGGEQPVAVFVPWQGSATYQRLDAFCRGVVEGLSSVLANGHPLVLAGDGDVGGLLGIHLHEEDEAQESRGVDRRLELKEFDYIDIGTMLESSGAVPVVIKSLIFPGQRDGRRSGARRPLQRNQQHHAQHGDRTAGGAGGETNRQAARDQAGGNADGVQHQRRRDEARAIAQRRGACRQLDAVAVAVQQRERADQGMLIASDGRSASATTRPAPSPSRRCRSRPMAAQRRSIRAPRRPPSLPGTSAAGATARVRQAARPRGRPPPSPAHGRGR